MAPPGRRLGSAYLRLSLTDQCNLRCCRYCRPASATSRSDPAEAAGESELVDLVRLIAQETGIHKLRLSGGEPLLYPNVAGLVARLRDLLPEATFALTTNGVLLARTAEALRASGLDSVNVSLDSLDARRFGDITGGGCLDATLGGIRAAACAGFSSLKLNTVLMRRVNGDHLADLVRFAARIPCEIRFIELMPFGQGAALFESDYLAAEEALQSLKSELCYLSGAPPTGTAARHCFLIDGQTATVGLIAPVSQPFCSRCDRLRLTRAGHLFACLRQSSFADLMTPLRTGDRQSVREEIRRSLCGKKHPKDHWPQRPMVAIGG